MGGASTKKLKRNGSVSSLTEIYPTSGVRTFNDSYDYYKTKGFSKGVLKVQLLFTAEGLDKCNPMVVVFEKTAEGELMEISRTEVKTETCEPVWVDPVFIYYEPDAKQPEMVFHVYGVGRKYIKLPVNSLKLDEQTFIGKCEQQFLPTLIMKDGISELPLSKDAEKPIEGTLIVRVEKTVAPTHDFEMVFRSDEPKSKRFLRISRYIKGKYIAIRETEVGKSTTWKSTNLTSHHLHRKDTRLVIQCFDFNSNGKHKLIGEIHTSAAELEMHHRDKRGQPIPSSSKGQKSSNAQIFVDSYTEKRLYRFSDYLKSNFQLEFIFAVDFTASTQQLDTYPQVISKVGESIGLFDFDMRFPAWGFGGVRSCCFNLDNSAGESEVEGIDGVVSAFSQARNMTTPASAAVPASARFDEVIGKAVKHALSQASCDQPKYTVLVIITPGKHADIKESTDASLEISECPISFLTVGVDGASCKQMEILEDDVLQFVPWSELQGGKDSSIEQLFCKLPEQFLEYMGSRGIKPVLASEGQL